MSNGGFEVPTPVDVVLDQHVFGEAVGGYVECSCGWPSHEEWNADEHEVVHVIRELREAGVLDRVGTP